MIKIHNRKKKKWQDFLLWFFVLALIFLSFVLIKNAYSAFSLEKKSEENRNLSEKKYKELEERQKNLLEEIEYLKTDKGLEAELRDKFRVAKEGEEMVVLLESPKKVVYLEEEKTFFQKIKIYFQEKISFIKKLLK